jgi:hypothetical protein
VVRYGETFKLRLVEDAPGGKYTNLDGARRRNGIRGASPLSKWIALWAGGYTAQKDKGGNEKKVRKKLLEYDCSFLRHGNRDPDTRGP